MRPFVWELRTILTSQVYYKRSPDTVTHRPSTSNFPKFVLSFDYSVFTCLVLCIDHRFFFSSLHFAHWRRAASSLSLDLAGWAKSLKMQNRESARKRSMIGVSRKYVFAS